MEKLLRSLVTPDSSESPSHMSLFQYSGFHFFPINALTITVHTLWCWKSICIVIHLLIKWDSGFDCQPSQICNYSSWESFSGHIFLQRNRTSRIYVYMYVCTYVYVHKHTHTQIHSHISGHCGPVKLTDEINHHTRTTKCISIFLL